MHTLAPHSPTSTRHFLAAMCAQANGQLAVQNLQRAPQAAALAHGHLSLSSVLALLAD